MSKRRSRKGPGTGTVVMLLAIGALGLGSLAAYVKSTPADRVPADQHRRQQGYADAFEGKPRATAKHDTDRVQIPVVGSGEKVHLVEESASGSDAKKFVVERTIETFGLKGGHVEHVNVAGGVAKIDLNQATLDGMGSIEGGMFLKALQMAMGQFDDVEVLQFTVDGQPIDSLDGHIEVTDPVPVIRPGAKPGETPAQP